MVVACSTTTWVGEVACQRVGLGCRRVGDGFVDFESSRGLLSGRALGGKGCILVSFEILESSGTCRHSTLVDHLGFLVRREVDTTDLAEWLIVHRVVGIDLLLNVVPGSVSLDDLLQTAGKGTDLVALLLIVQILLGVLALGATLRAIVMIACVGDQPRGAAGVVGQFRYLLATPVAQVRGMRPLREDEVLVSRVLRVKVVLGRQLVVGEVNFAFRFVKNMLVEEGIRSAVVAFAAEGARH